MVDPDSEVARPCSGLIIPKSIGVGAGRVMDAVSVIKSEIEQPPPRGQGGGVEQRIAASHSRIVTIARVRNDVEIAADHKRDFRTA